MERRERLDQYASLKMGQSTKVNGLSTKIKKTEEVCKYGPMEADTMDSGEMEWPMDKADSYTQREMSTKENGQTIKQMVLVCTPISMEADMKGNGTKTSSMALESNNGQMVPSTKVNTNRA
mgnify:CR=1 FL=1